MCKRNIKVLSKDTVQKHSSDLLIMYSAKAQYNDEIQFFSLKQGMNQFDFLPNRTEKELNES